jgi:hypothetical protein
LKDKMTALEKKWWFHAASSVVGALGMLALLHGAGIGTPDSLAQWIVAGLCFHGISRAFAFLAWLLVLLAWPGSPLLDRAPARSERRS